jgi:hypothetical protein
MQQAGDHLRVKDFGDRPVLIDRRLQHCGDLLQVSPAPSRQETRVLHGPKIRSPSSSVNNHA